MRLRGRTPRVVAAGSGRKPDAAADGTEFASSPVNVRIKIAAAWTSMLFVFAYVDLFSLYRSDVRADLDAGEVGPARRHRLLLTLILRPAVNRVANIVLAIRPGPGKPRRQSATRHELRVRWRGTLG